jgi:KipI family sensor histidine kinase inhibitor
MTSVPLGDRAIRIARPAGVAPRALVRELRRWPGAIDVVVARDDIAVYFEGPPPPVDHDRIEALTKLADEGPAPREHVLQARYDGPDLDDVARGAGLTPHELIRIHSGTTYTVETIGFAPGFAYLSGTDPRLALPGRATPRPRVPAGSLAIAAGYTAVYPFESPGGWHLIGTVDLPMFGPLGARLALGDHVRFELFP